MKMNVDYSKHTVHVGKGSFKTKLVPLPKTNVEVAVNSLYHEEIQPMNVAIIPVEVDSRIPTGTLVLLQPRQEFENEHELICSATFDMKSHSQSRYKNWNSNQC